MQTITDYPETCRQGIKTISDALKTDYETAYALLSLEAVLYDLYPSDAVVINMVLRDNKASVQIN